MAVITRPKKCPDCGNMGVEKLSKFKKGKGYTKKEFTCRFCEQAARQVVRKQTRRRGPSTQPQRKFSGGGGAGVKVTLTEWIASKKGLGIVQYGSIIRETEKAILLRTNDGQTIWLPKSQVAVVDSPIPTEERKREKPKGKGKWVVKEYEGSTDRLVQTLRFDTEEEALAEWERRTRTNKFAGVGGKWRHYYSHPEEEK